MSQLNLGGLANLSDDIESTKQLRQIRSYLVQLTDQLRYVLNNLGEENLSEEVTETIQQAVNGVKEISDNLGNYSTIKQTADAIVAGVANSVSKAELQILADSINATVRAIDGRLVRVELTAGGVALKLKDPNVNGDYEIRADMNGGGPGLAFAYYPGDEAVSMTALSESFMINAGYRTIYLSGGEIRTTGLLNVSNGMNVNGNMEVSGESMFAGNILPRTPDTYTLGQASGFRWKQLFANNSVNVASDRRLKKDISPSAALDVLDILKPYRYRLKNDDKQFHFGFIAQDVRDALAGLGLNDAALFNGDNPDMLSLVYDELIAVLVEGYQHQQKQIDALTARLAALEAKA